MAQAAHRTQTEKKGRAATLLLAVCLIIIVGGTTLPQRLAGMTNAADYSFAEILYGGVTAGVMIFVSLWYVFRNMSQRSGGWYRLTGIEVGLCVLTVAGIFSICLASDKRAAVNHIVFIVAPALMAILLVQVMDSAARVKVLLYTIAALGVVNTYECASQFYEGNDVMVQEYDKNPEAMLATVGIQPGTYEQMMFEYHLRSKDVRGYFTTSNSAGSFMLLAMFAAMAIVAEGYASFKAGRTTSGEMLGKCVVLAAMAWGLWLTQSKGAIGSAIVTLTLLLLWRIGRSWLWNHGRLVVVAAVMAVFVVAAAIILYGRSHGTLPGGKSMFVRWQYWVGAMRMYAEHPLGVGGGNFYAYYPQYKIPAAPETVKDPHNFILSVLTQYGPLGLLGFLAAVLVPLWLAVFPSRQPASEELQPADDKFGHLSRLMLLVVCGATLLIRPLVMTYETGTALGVALFVIAMLFILPLLLFAGTFFLTSTREAAGPFGPGVKAILVCGVAGVILHNCVDFAIFEPGVLMTFWASTAAIVAIEFISGRRTAHHIVLRRSVSIGAWLGWGVVAVAFVFFVLIPTSRAEYYLECANQAIELTDVPVAHDMFASASKADPLSPEPCYEDGRLYLYEFQTANPEPNLLSTAETALALAIDRDPQYYKYRGKLSEVYASAAQTARGDEKTAYLEKALATGKEALARYPGEASIHISVGDIADELGKRSEALDEYKKAVAIEDSYRRMFRQMYPHRLLYSRLGEQKYQYARSRIVELGGNTD